MLESENTSLSAKLNRQQWEVENRLAEIEMQICGAGSPADSATDDYERNFELAIYIIKNSEQKSTDICPCRKNAVSNALLLPHTAKTKVREKK